MIFKLELSPQNFHCDVLYPLYSVKTKWKVWFMYKPLEKVWKSLQTTGTSKNLRKPVFSKSHSFYYEKSRNGKCEFLLYLWTDRPVCKLQVCKSVLIEFSLSKQQKVFQIKFFSLCKWKYFPISTFVIIEEMGSGFPLCFLSASSPAPAIWWVFLQYNACSKTFPK